MKLSAEQLASDVHALAWSLLTPSLDYLDSTLAFDAALADETIRLGKPIVGWIRVHNRGHVGFIEIKDGVSGRFSHSPPPQVDPTSIPEVTVDNYLGKAHWLLDQLTRLVETLAAGRSSKLCSTGEPIEVEGRDIQLWTDLKVLLAQVKQAIHEGYNESIVKTWSQRLRVMMLGLMSNPDPLLARLELGNLKTSVSQLREECAADCNLVAWSSAYPDICGELEDHCRAQRMGPVETAAACVRYVASGAGIDTSDPIGTLLVLIDKCAREDLHFLAAKVGNRYLAEGERLLEDALNARSLSAFGDTLYRACPFFYSATRIFKGLTQKDRESVPVSAKADYRRRANVVEEHSVRIEVSLFNMVQNRTGAKLRMHKAQVRQARKAGGDAGAQQEIIRLIEMNYFYPRCWDQYLLDGTA